MKFNRSVKFILLWNILFCLGLSVYSVLFNLYLKEVISITSIGGVVGLSYIIFGLFSILSGIISDIIGSKKVLQFGVLILAAGITGNILTASTGSIYFWAIVTGVGQSMTNVMFVPLLTEHSENETRVKLFSFAFGTGNLFMFIGTLGAGSIADFLTTHFNTSEVASLRSVLLAGAMVIILSSLPLFAVKKKTKVQSYSVQKTQKGMDRNLLKKVSTYGSVKLLEGIGIGLTIPFLNLFLSDRFALKVSSVSIVLSMATLLTVGIIFLNPIISKRFGEDRTIFMYQSIGLPSLLLLGFMNNIWICIIGLLFFRACLFATAPLQSKLLMEKIPSNIKGFTNSLGFMASTIGTGTAGLFSMKVVSNLGIYWGYLTLFMISAVCITGSVVIFIFLFIGKTSLSKQKLNASISEIA